MKKLLAPFLASVLCLAMAGILIGGQPVTSNKRVIEPSCAWALPSEEASTPLERAFPQTTTLPAAPLEGQSPLGMIISWIAPVWETRVGTGGLGALAATLVILGLRHWLEERKLRLTHEHRTVEKQTESFHEYVFGHYMSILSSLVDFLWRIQYAMENPEDKLEGEDAVELSFFFFARYWATESGFRKKMKGFFLKDRVSENVISNLRAKIIRQVGDHFGRESLSVIEKYVDPDELFVDFKVKLGHTHYRLGVIFEQYRSWVEVLRGNRLPLDLLRCYHDLFIFEINKVYRPWYREKPGRLPREDLVIIEREVLNDLRQKEIITKRRKAQFEKKFND